MSLETDATAMQPTRFLRMRPTSRAGEILRFEGFRHRLWM
jgi:hypothetical protein